MSNRRYDSLSLLSPAMRAMALEFIARLTEQGIHFLIIETWRTPERQKELLASGHSQTTNSKHLYTMETETDQEVPASDAIDLAPYEVWDIAGPDKLLWDADRAVWQAMGVTGETVGFKWGGRWRFRDMGHWEIDDG